MGDRAQLGNTTAPPMTRAMTSMGVSRGMGSYSVQNKAPILAPYTLQEGALGEHDPKLQARLYEESVGYPNLADNDFVVQQAKMAVQTSLKDVFNVQEFLRNKWLILYRLYRGETLAQFDYGRTQLHSPEPFKAVENQHPRYMRALFGNQRWFKFTAEGNSLDQNATAQERMCRDQLRATRFLAKQSRFIRDGLIYGTAVQKCYWKQEHGEMTYRDGKRVPNPDFPGTTKTELKTVKRKEILFDGNHIDNVSIFDFLGPPNASDVETAEWAGDRSAWPDYKVKKMGEMGHWINLKQLKDHPGSNDTSFGDEFKERKSYAYGVFDPREASWAAHVPHYEVIDWWGPLVIKAQNGSYETRQCNVVMIEPQGPAIIARVTVNPFWHQKKPYQIWRPIALEQELYGIGTIEMIARMSLEKDMKRNLLMAATQLEANPSFVVSDEANIPDAQLMLRPGKVWRTSGDAQNAIVPVHIPQVSDAALKAENVLTQDIRETTGVTSPMMSSQSALGGGKTATQHISELDEANTRLTGGITMWELGVGEPMLNQMAWNNQQFLSYERVVREVGAFGLQYTDRYTIRPEDVIGRFLVNMLAGQRWTMKQQQVQQLINLLDRAPVVNQLYPNAIKMIPLWATILREGFDIRNVEDFVQMPPEDAGLLTALEEHQIWYHGEIPPIRKDDNHAVHFQAHVEELGSEFFQRLESRSPQLAARARAHVMEHGRWMAQLQEGQLKAAMEAAQAGSIQNLLKGGGGGGMQPAGPEGAATPNQDPDSPQVRANETARSNGAPTERPGGEAQSQAMSGAPNAGAS